ncbi:MAG: helix-turn-helix domain-containing GNAT family N-acetyltransferase [Acidovorax sp.]
MATASLIEQIRSASRTMVRELGFMESTLAGTSYSPSAVHALLEMENQGAMTSAQLVQVLGLEKSSVSRMAGKLMEAGEIMEGPDAQDGRAKKLALTPKGRSTVAGIHAYGEMQVRSALEHLDPVQRQAVAQGLSAYARALKNCRLGGREKSDHGVTIAAGYVPGMVGRIVEMHATFYSRHSNFGQFFESRVASGLAEFAGRLDKACNSIWTAQQGGRVVGSVAMDGEDLGNNHAHLRWFILDDGCRGGGIGRKLLGEALGFADGQGFAATQLWTFKGLDTARRLYESFGFELVHEEPGEQWGSRVTEQQFTRVNPAL